MSEHTLGAIRAAEAICGHDYSDKQRRFPTSYGSKTVEGIADLIDRETAAPELLAAISTLERYVSTRFEVPINEISSAVLDARAAIAKAKGSEVQP